jgi:hypothetical protein
MLFKEVIAVYSENHGKPINTLGRQNGKLMNAGTHGTYSNHFALYS